MALACLSCNVYFFWLCQKVDTAVGLGIAVNCVLAITVSIK